LIKQEYIYYYILDFHLFDNNILSRSPVIIHFQYEVKMGSSKLINRGCFFKKLCLAGMFSQVCSSVLASDKKVQKFRLLDHPRTKRDYSDGRSKKVIFLAHCIANQNARMHGCAELPAAVRPIVDFCLDNDIGIVQMPCPELMVTGLGRDRDEPEMEYLSQALRMPLTRERIRQLAEQVVFQMKEYRFQGFTMIGVLGKDGSPSCGVDITYYPEIDPKRIFGPGQGVFIEELKALMKEAGLELPVKGTEDKKWRDTIDWIRENLKRVG
jgi:predicted secreted protein